MRSGDNGSHDERAYSGWDRRSRESHPDEIEPVVLTRKYAEAIDGIDLIGKHVGDRLPLRSRDADILIAEGWAEPARIEERRRTPDHPSAEVPRRERTR